MPTRRPGYRIIYEGLDITTNLQPYLNAVEFTDVLEGESDTLRLRIENRDGRWMDTWMPGEGDTITVSLGYAEEPMLGPISFEIDETTWRGQPDTVDLKGLATPITKSLRQSNVVAYENTTLQEIAQTIAGKHGLELVGDIPDISFKRVTQKDEPDLTFLKNLSADYGSVFKIESLTKLVFFRESELEKLPPGLTFKRKDLSGYRLTRSATETYKQARVSYQDPESGEFIDVVIALDGSEVPEPREDEEGLIANDDILRISERVESLAIAKVRAVEALKRANRARVVLNTSVSGNVLLAAGMVIDLQDFYRLSGLYLVTEAKHSLASEYRTSFTARKI